MKQVSREEFYNTVGPLDACVSVKNVYKYPYTSQFKMRHSGRLVGEAVDEYTDGVENRYPIITKYYLNK